MKFFLNKNSPQYTHPNTSTNVSSIRFNLGNKSTLFWDELSMQFLIRLFFSKKSKTKHNKNQEIKKKEKRNSLQFLFLLLFLRRGLKKKYYVQLLKSMELVQRKFNFFDNTFATHFPSYLTYFTISRDDKTFFSFDFLATSCLVELTSVFVVQACRIPTKLKKRQKTTKKYNLATKYLENWKRTNWFLKQISLLSHHQNYYSLSVRLYFALTQLFLVPKNNRIYDAKLEAYTIMLNKYKNKGY